jgi:hypothetical protein
MLEAELNLLDLAIVVEEADLRELPEVWERPASTLVLKNIGDAAKVVRRIASQALREFNDNAQLEWSVAKVNFGITFQHRSGSLEQAHDPVGVPVGRAQDGQRFALGWWVAIDSEGDHRRHADAPNVDSIALCVVWSHEAGVVGHAQSRLRARNNGIGLTVAKLAWSPSSCSASSSWITLLGKAPRRCPQREEH